MAHFTDDLSAGLRAGMRRLAASVCIITLKDGKGTPHAMTATAVTSLSDDPPALLVCVNRQASAYPALMDHQAFCVNVLPQNEADLSVHCASRAEESRFTKGDWRTHEQNGLPYLGNAEAVFFCLNDRLMEYGSHLVAVGKITEVLTADTPLQPLLYADRRYWKLSEIS